MNKSSCKILFLLFTLLLSPALLKASGGVWLNVTKFPGQPAQDCYLDPEIAFDCYGNALAVWSQSDGSHVQIYYSHYDASTGSWSSATKFPGQPAQGGYYPQIAIDCSGNAFAAWYQGFGGNYRVYYSRYDVSTDSWSTSTMFPGQPDKNGGNPQIAFDCSGNAFAVWSQNDGSHDQIWYSRWDGSSWSNATTIPGQPAQDGYRNQIAVDCSGNAFAIWHQGPMNDYRIYYSRYDVSTGSWSNATTIPDQPAQDGWWPQIAIDCFGNAFAVWEQNDGSHDQIYYSRYDASTGSWSSATKFPGQPAQAGYYPQIAVDCAGNAFAVWEQNDGLHNQIYYSRYDASTDSWSNATKFPGQPAQNGWWPQIAIDCAGNVLVTWAQGNNQIYYSYYDGSNWSNATAIPNSAGANNPYPENSVDCSGNAFVVWRQNDGSHDQVWYSYFDAVSAPTVSAKQEFHRLPTRGDLINVLWWDPVTYLNPIVKYRIYCNPYTPQQPCCENCCDCKVVCCVCPCVGATLIGETRCTQFCHYARCFGQRVTYCVTAVDSQGNETPVPASVTVPAVS